MKMKMTLHFECRLSYPEDSGRILERDTDAEAMRDAVEYIEMILNEAIEGSTAYVEIKAIGQETDVTGTREEARKAMEDRPA